MVEVRGRLVPVIGRRVTVHDVRNVFDSASSRPHSRVLHCNLGDKTGCAINSPARVSTSCAETEIGRQV